LLPASVVNEIVDKEAAARGGVVSRKERQVMRENVIARLLPTALPKTTRTWVVLTSTGWAWVGCTSRGKAEDIISFLRETLGSFPAEPVPFASAPQRTLTRWVSTAETPEPFHFGEACEMRHPAEKSQVSRFAGADMTCEEIRNHLGLGMEVTRLALTWEDRLAFTVDADMALRGIQFLEGVLEEQDDAEVGDAALRLDADAQIACAEIESLIPVLYDALGGGAVNGVDDGVEFGLTGS
jgi:recombination associated protein RdgC